MIVIIMVVTVFTALSVGQFNTDSEKRELEFLTKCMHDATDSESKGICFKVFDK